MACARYGVSVVLEQCARRVTAQRNAATEPCCVILRGPLRKPGKAGSAARWMDWAERSAKYVELCPMVGANARYGVLSQVLECGTV
jgi:hypothetical protein